MSEKTQKYRIYHTYDIGDQSVYVEGIEDPSDIVAFIWFQTEDWFDEAISIPNWLMAETLVKFFKYKHSVPGELYHDDVNVYGAREERCGTWWCKNIKNRNPRFSVDDGELKEFLGRFLVDSSSSAFLEKQFEFTK
jgi:hypothetical protein